MATSDMSFWIKFFKEAGIPAGDAANYGVTFTDHRISRSMLLDLNKEYLNDVGITMLGDVIAILKHAKTVYHQDVRDKALRDTSVRVSTPTQELLAPKRSTPASRTIGHYIGSLDRSSSPSRTPSPNISRELSARLGNQPSPVLPKKTSISKITLRSDIPKEVVPVPKNRRVFPEHEGRYKISMPAGTTEKTRKILELQRQKAEQQRIKAEQEKQIQTGVVGAGTKTSVFSRLGSETAKVKAVAKVTKVSSTSQGSQPTITITGLGNINMPGTSTQASVFNRLGGKSTVKRPATSTVTFDDDDNDDDDYSDGTSLEYAGVFKSGASPGKKAKLEAAKKIKRAAHKTLVTKTAEVKPPASAGFLARSTSADKGIKARLGPKVAEVSSTTQPSKKTKEVSGIHSRLSTSKLDKITIRVDTTTPATSSSTVAPGIFSRLGKPKS